MVDYEYGAFFNDDSVKKEVIITYGNTTITNEDLFNQELDLTESLCSEEQLKFGSCEASVIKFKVANIVSPIKGNWISVAMAIGGHTENPIQFGRYKVESDKPTSDRKWREIIAYDALYDIVNDNVSEWYNSVLPNKDTYMTLSQFRKLFLQKYGLQEDNSDSLVNDGMVVTRTIDPDELSGAKVMTAICELNGCFGHIGRNGKFKNILLHQGIQGLYPRNDLYPANDIYPRDPKSTPIGKGIYIACKYEDFTVRSISGVDIYREENAFGGSSGSSDNKYVVEDNFLIYGKSENELSAIAHNLLSVIRGIDYRPFDAECKGNPCFEVGDPVRFSTKYEIVESYILSRTLKGTQALKDSYSALGTEKYEIKVNSTNREISQVSGKTEQLEREYEEQKGNIEEINSDIDYINQDIDDINQDIGEINSNVGNLKIELKKTDEGLQAEVSRALSAEEKIGSRITMTEASITAEVGRAIGEEQKLYSRIQMTESSITAEVTRATQAEGTLSSRINMTADSITAEVTRATSAEGTLSSRIDVTAENIKAKVSKGDVVSEINLSPDEIRLDSGRLIITSGNCTLDKSGNIGLRGGTIGSFTLTNYGALKGSGIEINSSQLWCNDIVPYNGDTVEIGGRLYVNLDLKVDRNVYFPNVYSNNTTADPNLHITNTGYLNTKGGSSRKWKHDIRKIQDQEIHHHRLYNTRTCEFIYNDGYLFPGDHRIGKRIPGFAIEDLEKDYPIAVDYDENGNLSTWSPSMFIAPMIELHKEHHSDIEDIKDMLRKIISKIGGI